MASHDSQLGRNEPQTPRNSKSQPRFNGRQSGLDGSFSRENSPSAGSVFSSPGSIATDITDDYGCETPIKHRKSATRRKDTSTATKTLDANENKEQSEYDESPVRKSTNSSPPSIPSGKEKLTKTRKAQLRASLPGSESTNSSVLGKQRENLTSPTESPGVASNGKFSETTSLEGISLFSTDIESKEKKKLRQTRIDYWIAGNLSDIKIDFSPSGSKIIRPRAVSYNAAERKSLSDQVSRPQQQVSNTASEPLIFNVPIIKISPPEDGKEHSSKAIDKRSEVRLLLNLLETIPSSASINEEELIRKSLSKIMPLEIRQRLAEDTSHCSARTAQGLRCKRRHHADRKYIVQSLQSLTTLKSSEIFHCIEGLIEGAFCSSPHQRVAKKELQSWEKDFDKLSKIRDPKHHFSLQDYRLLALVRWISLLGKEEVVRSDSESPPLPKAETDGSSDVPTVLNLIQDFRPYVTKKRTGAVADELKKLLIRPLLRSEIKNQGFMYIFWQPGNFGHLKIGWSGDVRRRLASWSRQCKKTIEAYYPNLPQKGNKDAEDLQPVPHICRVEALVHMELKNCRKIENNCPGCSKSHKEWFEIPERIAIEVVRKWMDWMRTLPYEKRSIGGEDQWVLKDEQVQRLNELSRPHKEIAISGPETKSRKNATPAARLSLPHTERRRSPRLRTKSM